MTKPAELPPHVQEFVAGLNENDVEMLKSLMRLGRDVQGLCRVVRWVVYGALLTAFAVWQGVDGIRHLLGLASSVKTGN